MPLPKFYYTFTTKINRSILHEYHPFSKQKDEIPSNPSWSPDSRIAEIYKAIASSPTVDANISLEFLGEEKDSCQIVEAFFNFKQEGEYILHVNDLQQLIGIIDAYVQHDYRLWYVRIEMQEDVATTRKVDDALLEEARELLKRLRNLLYMRDVYQGETTLIFECQTASEADSSKMVKDKEMSTEIKIHEGQSELLELAIESDYRNIANLFYNPYLQNLAFWRPEIECTYDSINRAYESLKKPETGKTREVSKDNLFRGKLVQVIKKYISKHALVDTRRLMDSTVNEKCFDILAAFGFVDDDKVSSYGRRQKADYIRHLPTEGFPEIGWESF